MLEMPKIVSVETIKKQENDFITRVILANLVFVFRIQSRDQPALRCTPRLRFSRMRRRKSRLFTACGLLGYLWKDKFILCISQFQRCPSPPRATPGELAISGKKMAMSPPQGKKNCAKAPPLGKKIGSISPPGQ
jgi:hypothetical protein